MDPAFRTLPAKACLALGLLVCAACVGPPVAPVPIENLPEFMKFEAKNKANLPAWPSITLPLTQQPPTGLVTTPLDAGPVINLNGPNGTKQILQTMGYYFAQVGGGTSLQR